MRERRERRKRRKRERKDKRERERKKTWAENCSIERHCKKKSENYYFDTQKQKERREKERIIIGNNKGIKMEVITIKRKIKERKK